MRLNPVSTNTKQKLIYHICIISMSMMCMTKTRTNISINKELLKKAREYDINISAFVEYNLRIYFAQIEGKNITGKSSNGLVEIRTQDLRHVKATS